MSKRMPDSGHTGTMGRFIAKAWFGPALLAALFVVLLGGLLWLIRSRMLTADRADLAGNAATAQESIHQRLNASRDYLIMLAEDMARGAVTAELLQRRLPKYMADHPELVSVVYVAADGIAQWSAPPDWGSNVLGSPLACPQSKRGHLQALRTGGPVYSRTHISLQGHPAFDVNVPVRSGEEVRGTLLGVYSCERTLRHMLHREILQQYRISLVDGEGNVIALLPTAAPLDKRLAALQVHAPNGYRTVYRFEELVVDKPIDGALFRPALPAGWAQVVEE